MIDNLKKSILQLMQLQSHEIKYQKQVIESTVRHYREKTKGDIWTEILNWYDFINELECATQEIRRELSRYSQLREVLKNINEYKNKEQQ